MVYCLRQSDSGVSNPFWILEVKGQTVRPLVFGSINLIRHFELKNIETGLKPQSKYLLFIIFLSKKLYPHCFNCQNILLSLYELLIH